MRANSHHRPLLVAAVALQIGVATAAVLGLLRRAYRALPYRIYGVCIGILACRGLSLVSSPLHAMKSPSQILSSAAVNLGV
ncbi:hypothetical protein Tco_0257331 [Tanacetum coccineum]